jgi:hypothetical protein
MNFWKKLRAKKKIKNNIQYLESIKKRFVDDITLDMDFYYKSADRLSVQMLQQTMDYSIKLIDRIINEQKNKLT